MRRIVYALSEIRKGQLSDRKAPPERLAEVDDLFRKLDSEMSGIRATTVVEPLQEIMTSADFTYAIQEFVQRLAYPAYQRMTFAFEPLVKPDTVPNYLPATRLQKRAGLERLEYIGEKGRARPGSVVDATKKQISAFRWEKQFDFSYEALRNDDLGYFNDQAALMGQVARQTLEEYVSRMYFNAATIARLILLGVLYSQNGRLTSGRVSECRMAFGQRVDDRNRPIQADLAYVVYHRGLEDVTLTIEGSEKVPELATNAANVVRGKVQYIKDPYLTGTAPNLPWFGFVDWRSSNIVPFVLARLEGWPGPRIVRKKSDIEAVTSMLGAGIPVEPILGDFDSGNVVLAVWDVFGTYIDFTAGAANEGNMFDPRGCYYAAGTAP